MYCALAGFGVQIFYRPAIVTFSSHFLISMKPNFERPATLVTLDRGVS